MSLGGFFSSESQAMQNQAAADNEARQAASGSNQANEGSVVISPGKKGSATYVAPNSISVSGSNLTDNSKVALLTDGSRAESITINNSDSDLIESLAGKFIEAGQQQSQALAGILAAKAPAHPETKTTAPTDIESPKWKPITAGLVVVVAIWWLLAKSK